MRTGRRALRLGRENNRVGRISRVAFDVSKAAARGGVAGRAAPSAEVLRSLGSRPVLERIEEIRRIYARSGGVAGGVAGVSGARAWETLLKKHRELLGPAHGVTSRAQIMARVVGELSDGASSFSLPRSPFLPNLRPSPFLPSFSPGGPGASRYYPAAYPMARQPHPMAYQFVNATGVAGPFRASGLYGSIAASLEEMGFGAGGPYYGETFEDWRLRQIRGSRDHALRSLLRSMSGSWPSVITPEWDTEEGNEYHPDLRSWDVPDTGQDPEERWAEGIARGIARHHRSLVLLRKLPGDGARWGIQVAKRHVGASFVTIGLSGGLMIGGVTGEVAAEAIKGGLGGAAAYLYYLLTLD